MDQKTLVKEIKFLTSPRGKLESRDFHKLAGFYPDVKTIENFQFALQDRKLLKKLLRTPSKKLETGGSSIEEISIIKIDGVKIVLKKINEFYLNDYYHEFFVSRVLTPLDLPVFSPVLGCGYGYVLSPFIKGITIENFFNNPYISFAEKCYTINFLIENLAIAFEETGFIHQDIRSPNIIIIPLKKPTIFNLQGFEGPKVYQLRYLPKLIDYGLSRIIYNDEIFATSLEGTHYRYDVLMILRILDRILYMQDHEVSQNNFFRIKAEAFFLKHFGKDVMFDNLDQYIKNSSSEDINHAYHRLQDEARRHTFFPSNTH